LVALDGLVFFSDGSLCGDRASAGVFSDILNVRASYALGSHATVFQFKVYNILACSKYFISEGIVNRAISICSDSMPFLPELYYSVEILFRNWLCLREFNWCGFLDTGLSMNEVADALARAGLSSAFVGPEPCRPLAPSSVKRREREWLLKSHCA
jgi:hypothetical protein